MHVGGVAAGGDVDRGALETGFDRAVVAAVAVGEQVAARLDRVTQERQ